LGGTEGCAPSVHYSHSAEIPYGWGYLAGCGSLVLRWQHDPSPVGFMLFTAVFYKGSSGWCESRPSERATRA